MDLIPRSRLSWICIGIFGFHGIFSFVPTIPILPVGLGILLLHYFLKILHSHTRWVYHFYLRFLILGISLGAFHILFSRYAYEEKQSLIQKFLSLYESQEVLLSPIRKIQGNIWLYQIRGKPIQNPTDLSLLPPNYQISVPVRIHPEMSIRSMNCPLSAISYSEDSGRRYLKRILDSYGGRIFYLPKRGCTLLDSIPPQEFVKREVSRRIKSGGIFGEMHGVAMALVFGESSFLSRETYESAKKTGTLHLFAASGLHIGILFGSLYAVGKYVFRFGYYGRLIFPIIFGFGYLYLLSFPVSLSRAFLFALILVSAKLVFRKAKPLDMILLSSCVILIFKGEAFLSVGFLLSYLAVVGIFFLKPRIDSMVIPIPAESKFLQVLRDNLTLTLSANLATFPVVWNYFEGFSYGSVFSNCILVPLTGVLLPILYLSIVLSFLNLPFTVYAENLLWSFTDLFLRVLLGLNEWFAQNIGFYRIWSEKQNELFSLLILVALIFFIPLLGKHVPNLQKKFQPCFSILLMIGFVSWFAYGYLQNSPKTIHKSQGLEFFSHNSFLWIDEKEIHIGGCCKYDSPKLRRIISPNLCQSKETIYIEHESCMFLVRFCLNTNSNLGIRLGSKSLKDWNQGFPEKQWAIVPKKSTFDWKGETLFIYKLGYDTEWLPRFLIQKFGRGWILIQNPKSIPSGKKLGFWEGWKILNSENDLLSLLQSEADPNRSWRNGDPSPKIVGSELPD